MKILAWFDNSSTVTALIAAWFGVMGGVLLWGGALLLGAICFWACGMNCSRWLNIRRGS